MWIFKNFMTFCQHLYDVHNSINQYFPKGQYILQSHGCIKGVFQGKDKLM
jgi:hypothetical protein